MPGINLTEQPNKSTLNRVYSKEHAMNVTIPPQLLSNEQLVEQVDYLRQEANHRLDSHRRVALGQFMTPAPIARLMASMLVCDTPHIALLDAGAGVGSLFSAAVEALCRRALPPQTIHITAYEVEPLLLEPLHTTLHLCDVLCRQVGIIFTSDVITADFLAHTSDMLSNPLFAVQHQRYTCAILNPPYRKIQSDSAPRKYLRQIGFETSNLYPGFLALAVHLLAPDGELVAITPRSFCNGPYFRPFRKLLLEAMALRHIHIFESRQQAFRDDTVLQENIILSAVKTSHKAATVTVTAGIDQHDELPEVRELSYEQIVYPHDAQMFIHIISDAIGEQTVAQLANFTTTLADLGLTVSTGRVVDFRVAAFLRAEPGTDTIPLIYPSHFVDGAVQWPRAASKKPNAMIHCSMTHDLLVPNDHYVLVKRFSAKEEHRRVNALVYNPSITDALFVGFENHLNYIHKNGRGLESILAAGIACFLNSTLIDTYFRQFSGHTQVNANDLRTMLYPTYEQLVALGSYAGERNLTQGEIDLFIAQEFINMGKSVGLDPLQAKKRIDETLSILKSIGLPRAQQNERSALTLLALLRLTPDQPWSSAHNPLCGITPMMEFFSQHYGKNYKPNTRETVRRQTVHQFLEAGLVIANPDEPERPINSPKAVYQIEQSALELLRSYETTVWEQHLQTYLASVVTLQQRYAQERQMQRIPIRLASGEEFKLSAGGQNVLMKAIIDEFTMRYTPGGEVLYVGDTDAKFGFFAAERLHALGVTINEHGKMPDIIVYHSAKNWLVLIEAVTSHGPINPKRRNELNELFKTASVGLVYVTAFLTRAAMKAYLADISWETEVWVAESPDHLIHFNGERFLGPH